MIFDKVDYAEICGWNMNVCVEQMQKILSFDTQYKTRWPDANALRWNEELYERVINHKIPSKALEELCF